jgi:hypothetical protein
MVSITIPRPCLKSTSDHQGHCSNSKAPERSVLSEECTVTKVIFIYILCLIAGPVSSSDHKAPDESMTVTDVLERTKKPSRPILR